MLITAIILLAIVAITVYGVIVNRNRWQYVSQSCRMAELARWQHEAFTAIAGPGDAYVTDYYLCSVAEAVCRDMGVEISQQKKLLATLEYYLFQDGRGGSSCTQPECKDLVKRSIKDPVVREFALRMNKSVNYYADNNAFEVVAHRVNYTQRQMWRVVWFTMGHEWRHTEQTYAFIQEGRPHPIVQAIALNPIVVLLTFGWTYRKYTAIPSETDANNNGIRLLND